MDALLQAPKPLFDVKSAKDVKLVQQTVMNMAPTFVLKTGDKPTSFQA